MSDNPFQNTYNKEG